MQLPLCVLIIVYGQVLNSFTHKTALSIVYEFYISYHVSHLIVITFISTSYHMFMISAEPNPNT